MRSIRAVAGCDDSYRSSGTAFSAAAQNAKPRPRRCSTQAIQAAIARPPVARSNRNSGLRHQQPARGLALVDGCRKRFCQYTLAEDGSRIHLSLDTLFTTKPTLAALAYYAEVPWNGQGNGNPASFYCTQLGGAEIGATDFAGGGWVLLGALTKRLRPASFRTTRRLILGDCSTTRTTLCAESI